MSLVLTEEQELLKETAREFAQERSPVSALRQLRDDESPDGLDRALWKEMAELGWVGATLDEDVGGSGLGYAELGPVLEECGRTLMAHAFVSTVLLGAEAIRLGGSEAQQKDVLPQVASGDRLLALAFQETGRFDPYRCSTRADAADGGFRITGEKTFVLDGHIADQLIVVARTAGDERDRDGLSLFLLDAKAAGIEITRTKMVDSRNAARVKLDGVQVDRSALIGAEGSGADVLDLVLDRAAIGLSAEMLGSTLEAYERTLTYLKERVQFGVPIGSFQALKHRAADMFCEVELSKSVVLEALRAIDAGRPDAAMLASACKARLSDTAILVANEAVQMHGGIGMTDEEEIGFFLKRAKATELTFGDAAYHRDRYAKLEGY